MNSFRLIVDAVQFIFQGKKTLPQTKTTFKALVKAIIPPTPSLTKNQPPPHVIGATELHVDEYLIYALDHYLALKIVFKNFNFYLANATAKLLNAAAGQLIAAKKNKKPADPAAVSEKGLFAALDPADRCRVIALLEQLQVDLGSLPVPFYNSPETVLAVISIVTMLITGGCYSEWPAYGSTRLAPPEQRRIENFPAGWKQTGYPGPAKGYHAMRSYLITEFTEQEG